MEENQGLRTLGSLLTHLLNKNIIIVGKVIKVEAGKILIKSTDNQTIFIISNEECQVGNFIEAVGISTRQGVVSSTVLVLNNELMDGFDDNSYNKTLEISAKNSDDYIQNDVD